MDVGWHVFKFRTYWYFKPIAGELGDEFFCSKIAHYVVKGFSTCYFTRMYGERTCHQEISSRFDDNSDSGQWVVRLPEGSFSATVQQAPAMLKILLVCLGSYSRASSSMVQESCHDVTYYSIVLSSVEAKISARLGDEKLRLT